MNNKIWMISGVILVLIIALAAFSYFRKNNSEKTEVEQEATTEQTQEPLTQETNNQPNQAGQGSAVCERNFDQKKFDSEAIDPKDKKVKFDVEGFGEIVMSFDEKAAPKTVENFLKLVNAGFYDCLTFHRVAKGFVIQGGDPKGDGSGGPGYTVPAEIKLTHKRGSIAMARLPDQMNPKKESSGSQFYIALNDLAMLDGQYTVFGIVEQGLDVVDKIGAVEIEPGPFGATDGAPVKPVVIKKASIIK